MRIKIFTTFLFITLGFIAIGQDNNISKEEYYAKRKKMMESGNNLLENETSNYQGNTRLINIAPDLYFLKGTNSNMGIYLYEENFYLIDTQIEEEMDRNLKIISRLNKKASVKYLISTSNELKARKAAMDLKNDGTLFVAQKLSQKLNQNKKNGKAGYTGSFKPDLAYVNEIDLNIGDKKIEIVSINNEGNSMVFLPKNNVLFTGPIYTNKKYPNLDFENGNRLNFILSSLPKIILKADDNTIIVPGKGAIAKKSDVVNYKKVMARIAKQVATLIQNGKTLENVLAMKSITKNLDSQGFGEGSVTTEMFMTSLYNEIAFEMGPVDSRSPEERAMERLKEMQKDKEKKNE